jgi:hypothetical protein
MSTDEEAVAGAGPGLPEGPSADQWLADDAETEPSGGAWPELEATPASTERRVRRPLVIVLAVVLLAIDGVGGLLSGFLTPFLPEALANVAPVLTGLMGLGGLTAAFGVWRTTEWGRLLGMGVALGWLIRDGLLTQAALSLGLDPLLGRTPDPLFDWVLPLTLDVLILGALALRWPREKGATPRA